MRGRLAGRVPARYHGLVGSLFWVIAGVVLALVLTTFAFRSFRVDGISMEPTLKNGNILLVSKLGRTLGGNNWVPKRDALVVFKNPLLNQGEASALIVKRVIGLPGDRVVVANGRITVYHAANPSVGLDPDASVSGPVGPTSGNVDVTVSSGELFVVGDNRQGNNSFDSRNGLSTVPISLVEGTVALRFWPLNNFRFF